MYSVAALESRAVRALHSRAPAPLQIALLGCGNVGGAFAALVGASTDRPMRITRALVRDCHRPRPTLQPDAERVTDAAAMFDGRPNVVVELLGGIEPARTLVCTALMKRIPVVTANKSLLAAYGAELREIAARTGTALMYEAAVIAGVPFLGTFGRRPHAARVTSLTAIANGTSNFILTRAREERCGIEAPLAEAQRLGYAEPDPSKDIDGVDAAEKLVVLLQHFAGSHVATDAIEVTGIRSLQAADIFAAADLDGTIKPLISADWSQGLNAFVGPAFVPKRHPIASVDNAENVIILNGPLGRLLFQGPGAGPDVTAATVMDDVLEAVSGVESRHVPALHAGRPAPPDTGWFIRIHGTRLPHGSEIADLLASYGIYLRRTNDDRNGQFSALSWPAHRIGVERALAALHSAAGCATTMIRALDV